jgi:hypothetical protein
MSSVYLRSFRVRRGEVKVVQVTCLTVPARIGVVANHHDAGQDALSSASASASANGARLAEPPRGSVRIADLAEPHGLRGRAVAAPARALSPRVVRALRAAGAAGGTSLRGIWGDHARHGDTSMQLRRRVPVVTVRRPPPSVVRTRLVDASRPVWPLHGPYGRRARNWSPTWTSAGSRQRIEA